MKDDPGVKAGREARPVCPAGKGLGWGVRSPTPCTWGPFTPPWPCENPVYPPAVSVTALPPLCDVMGLCDITVDRAGLPLAPRSTGGSSGRRRYRFLV